MITSRERIRISELIKGFFIPEKEHISALKNYLNLDKKHFNFVNMGKAAFEQVIISSNLGSSRVLVPAFFPHDFVGLFSKYNITPVFVDVDPNTYHLALSRITESDLVGVRALILLHTFGLPADGKQYRAFCDKHNLLLIEDCARAFGANDGTFPVGTWGDFAIFSLPKCTPVRQGGIVTGNLPLNMHLQAAHTGLTGLLHALALVKYPIGDTVAYQVYKLIVDTPVYPREVGIYDLLPSREFDRLGKFFFKAFFNVYPQAIAEKRKIAMLIRSELEPLGFIFQADNGHHIYTSLSLTPPSGCDSTQLVDYLLMHGIKVSTMWRDALGVSLLAQEKWQAVPERSPVAKLLAEKLLQLPISRFQSIAKTKIITETCKQFLSEHY